MLISQNKNEDIIKGYQEYKQKEKQLMKQTIQRELL